MWEFLKTWKCLKCNETLNDVYDVCWKCGADKEGKIPPQVLGGAFLRRIKDSKEKIEKKDILGTLGKDNNAKKESEKLDSKKCPYCSENINAEAVKCRFCGEFLKDKKSGVNELVKPTAKQTNISTGLGVLLIAFFSIFIIVPLFNNCKISGNSSSSSIFSTKPETYNIRYRITGTARRADITISTPGGSTEQHPIYLPYTGTTYKFKSFDHAYISAQNSGERGTITAEILVDGSVRKTATSAGAYRIASVSWLVGSED